MNQDLIKETDNQRISLLKSIDILAELTRDDVEKSSNYFDVSFKLETQSQ